jgi:hypothetical protein
MRIVPPLLLLGVLVSWQTGIGGADKKKPEPKVPLGKETTYITGPLGEDGYLDYAGFLNEKLGQGVTADNNAVALLMRALGPRANSVDLPPEFFKALGIDKPPERGNYFVPLTTYLKDHDELQGDERNAIFDQERWATQRSWAEKDFPHIAAWLKANERPLAVAVEATKRPKYFEPVVCKRSAKGREGLVGALLPGAHGCREIATALAARAMLRVDEGKFEEAWQDLLACHRLGRLVGHGPTLIQSFVAIAIDLIPANADLVWLERAGMTVQPARGCLQDLQRLPPLPTIADKIDLAERFLFLDSMQLVRRDGLGLIEAFAGGPPREPTAKEQDTLATADWGLALRMGNRWYDRIAAAMRVKNRPSREKQFDRIEKDLTALKKEAEDQTGLRNALLNEEAQANTWARRWGRS